MSLSCGCGEWDGEGWAYYFYDKFKKLATTRRKRCWSCKVLIDIGSECLEFPRFQHPNDELSAMINGEDCEMPLASWYACESCGEIFLNLNELGYCFNLTEDLRESMEDYHKLTGFTGGNT